jgi:hypothetical protein
MDVIAGIAGACHALPACSSTGAGAADGADASCGGSCATAPSGDGEDTDVDGSGFDSASDTKGEPNEPSGCCADAEVDDRNGLDVEICVRLGEEVTAV